MKILAIETMMVSPSDDRSWVYPLIKDKGIFWSLTGLDILLTGGRFLVHWRKLKKIRIDDIFNGLALLFLIAFMITWQRYVPVEYKTQLHAAGLSEGTPPRYDPIDALKNDSANLLMYWCTIYAVKASFLGLYWQIFEVSRRFRIAWYAIATYVGLSFAISFLSFFWHCGTPATLIDPRKSLTPWEGTTLTIR